MPSSSRPGWPPVLPPPGEPGWQRRAGAYLLDLCPPDYRAHSVIAHQPAVLGWLAVRHVHACLEAARQALAQARHQLHDVVPPETIARLVPTLEGEVERLAAQVVSARAVAEALLSASRADLLRAQVGGAGRAGGRR